MSSSVTSPQDTARQTAALESLADLIDRKQYLVSLASNPGRRPRLCVSNRDHGALTEWIYAEGEWYWWPWGDRLGIVAEPDVAAAVISRVLQTVTS